MGKTVFDPATPGQKEIGGGSAPKIDGGVQAHPPRSQEPMSCVGHITPQVAKTYKYSDDYAPVDMTKKTVHHAGGLQPADGVLRPGVRSARSGR